jgi:predicted peroxiredoxin
MNEQRLKLSILLWAATPERPELLGAPFGYAATAAAMDAEVEMHFSGRAVRLLVADVALRLPCPEWNRPNVYDCMRDAAEAGVRFFGCSTALKTQLQAGERMIAEFRGAAGSATFIQRSLDPDWRTLVF